jgi:hypothetical protein
MLLPSIWRPDVRQARRNIRPVLLVVLGVLEYQVALVAEMKAFCAHPVGRASVCWSPHVLVHGILYQGDDAFGHVVCVAATPPLVAHGDAVLGEGKLATLPHPDGRMVCPAVRGRDASQCLKNLIALNPLLVQPLAIQNPRRLEEIRHWQKGLHTYLPTDRCSADHRPSLAGPADTDRR